MFQFILKLYLLLLFVHCWNQKRDKILSTNSEIHLVVYGTYFRKKYLFLPFMDHCSCYTVSDRSEAMDMLHFRKWSIAQNWAEEVISQQWRSIFLGSVDVAKSLLLRKMIIVCPFNDMQIQLSNNFVLVLLPGLMQFHHHCHPPKQCSPPSSQLLVPQPVKVGCTISL
jgi:hypothetical protein